MPTNTSGARYSSRRARSGGRSATRSLSRRTIAFVAFTCLLMLAAEGWREWVALNQHIHETRLHLCNLASAIEQSAEDTVRIADVALANVVAQIEADGTSPAALAAVDHLLVTTVADQPRIQGIVAFGTDGFQFASSLPGRGPGVRERNYFRHHRENPDRAAFLGAPVRNNFNGHWIVTVSRRIQTPDGVFAGVVIAGIDISYFIDRFSTYDLGRGGSITLSKSDGTLLARAPWIEQSIGDKFPGAAIVREQPEKSQGSFENIGVFDGQLHLTGFRRGDQYPLVVLASVTKAAAIAAWRADALAHVGITLSLTAIVALLGLVLARQMWRGQVAADQLRLSEEFLERTGRAASVGGWELDLQTNTIRWSAETCRIHGVSEDYQPTPESVLAFYAADASSMLQEAAARSMAGGGGWDQELPLIRADGQRALVRVIGATEFDGETPVRLIGAFQDVTDQVAARLALEHAHERLTLATRSGGIGIWNRDIEHDRLEWDSCMYGLFGETPRDDVSPLQLWCKHLHPDDRGTVEQAMRDAIDGQTAYDTEFRIVLNDGGIRHLRAAGRVTRDPDGRPVRIVGVNWDITEQRELAASLTAKAARLAQSEEEFRLLTENANDTVTRVAVDGGRRYFSPAASRIYGLPAEVLMQRDFMDFVHPDDHAAVAEFQRQLRGGIMAAGKLAFRVFHVDGRAIWIESSARSLRDPKTGAPDGYISVLRDVTERVRLEAERDAREDELRAANERLERLARHLSKARDVADKANAAKSDFLATMSHEIRSPMSALVGVLELLRETRLSPDQGEMANMAHGSALVLLAVLNDILDFSKIEAGALSIVPEPTGLFSLVNELVQPRVFEAGSKGVDLTLRIDPAIPDYISVDPLRLRQILGNLLSNALKFTASGEIHLSVDIDRDGARERLRFAVRDTGIGMTDAVMARLFEPFMQADSTTTRDFGGTGLGLCICRRLADLLDGTLTVTSRVGEGSVFTLLLPLTIADVPAPDGRGAIAATSAQAFAGRHVLVVDDVHTIRWLSKRKLEQLGLRVSLAEDGETAIAMLREDRYDLVVTDCHMPRMDGVELTRALRAHADPVLRGLPVIGLTADVTDAQRERCRDAGMCDVAIKPLGRARMFELLSLHLPPTSPGTNPLRAVSVAAPVPTCADIVEAACFETAIYHDLFAPDDPDGEVWLEAFLREAERLADEVAALVAVASDDLLQRDALVAVAHRLLGVALSGGANRLAAVARTIQDTAARDTLAALRSRQSDLRDEFVIARTAIAAFMTERKLEYAS